MERYKTILFYTLAAAGLIVASLWFTSPGDPAKFRLPPTFTPRPTAKPSPVLATPAGAAKNGCVPTPGGPAYSYQPDTPFSVDLAPPDLPGQRIVISGTIYANDCVTPLPGVLVEVWHADTQGQYDRTPPYILRGKMRTNASGQYEFASIKPGVYQIGESTQPAHIHYQIIVPNYGPFDTRLLFKGDPYLSDAMAHSPLAIPLTPGKSAAGPVLRGVFDIILPVAPATPTPAPTSTDEAL
jgi:catechol 1,2-dioxygenase